MHPLKKWRTDNDLTLAQAGELVGTSRQTWFGWETGRRKPSDAFMGKIRAVTEGKVTANDFYDFAAVA
ncbi:MAG: hypothetical protein B7Y88_13775 [Sphingomonadales bacterium 32-64-17]|nr:MAG: hypothetical protein B7Y88_13775 [Sphingomonadales bacterium 32-64-17]